jgi:hypothetical protein
MALHWLEQVLATRLALDKLVGMLATTLASWLLGKLLGRERLVIE